MEGVRLIVDRGGIDLLFTDVGLPGGVNGRALADAARSAQPGLRVLFTTGYTQQCHPAQRRAGPRRAFHRQAVQPQLAGSEGPRGAARRLTARRKHGWRDERNDRTRHGRVASCAPCVRAQRQFTARRIAVVIAALAAALALAEMGEKGAQNAYLTHHIAVSDDWAFYQAKNARATTWAAEAGMLANLPNAADAGTAGGDQARQGERGTTARRTPGRRDEATRASGRRPGRRARRRRSTDTTSSSWWSARCRSPSCWHRWPW